MQSSIESFQEKLKQSLGQLVTDTIRKRSTKKAPTDREIAQALIR